MDVPLDDGACWLGLEGVFIFVLQMLVVPGLYGSGVFLCCGCVFVSLAGPWLGCTRLVEYQLTQTQS